MKVINYYNDPGHGWMETTKTELKELGIADKISSYSYQNGNLVYLEEDCDATTYLNHLSVEYKFNRIYADEDSPIRLLIPYNGGA